MIISIIIWKILHIQCLIFQSKQYYMDKYMSKSCQELLDSRFYCERLVILLLYTVSSLPSSCIFIKLYLIIVNIRIKLGVIHKGCPYKFENLIILFENNVKNIRMKTIFEIMSLHCVLHILYWIQAEWRFYIQTYCQIIAVNFTNMVAIIFFLSGRAHSADHPPSPCQHFSTVVWPPSPVMYGHHLWMAPYWRRNQNWIFREQNLKGSLEEWITSKMDYSGSLY